MNSFPDWLTIRKRVDAVNEPQPSFSGDAAIVLRSIPGRVKAVSAGEKVRGRQLEATTTWSVEIYDRAVTPITAAMRVDVIAGRYKGKQLQINKVLPVHDRPHPPVLLLECTEVV